MLKWHPGGEVEVCSGQILKPWINASKSSWWVVRNCELTTGIPLAIYPLE